MSLGCFLRLGTRDRVLFHFSHKPELRVLSVGCIFVDESAVRKHLAVKHPDLHTAEPVDMDSINRNAISIDGMPVCSGCRVNFLLPGKH